jgi:DNA-binding CsgD family transcriptional regulator
MSEAGGLGVASISARETEVLTAVGEHLTNAEIGAKLFISVRAVESHVSSLLHKLGAADRRELADLAGRLNRAGQADGSAPPRWSCAAARAHSPRRAVPMKPTS